MYSKIGMMVSLCTILHIGALSSQPQMHLNTTQKRDVRAVDVPAGTACNMDPSLCSKRYDQVAYALSHNGTAQAPSAVNNQNLSLADQMKFGIRATKIPIHFEYDLGAGQGQNPMASHGIYRSTLYDNYGQLIQTVVGQPLENFFTKVMPYIGPIKYLSVPKAYTTIEELPQDVQNYMQAITSIATMIQTALPLAYGSSEVPATIPFQPCIIDPFSRPLQSVFQDIKTFLDQNPYEVCTLFIESTIPIDIVGSEIVTSGLSSYAWLQQAGAPWPLLQDMIESGQRLVIFGPQATPNYPWLLNETDFVASTPYSFSTKKSLAAEVSAVTMGTNQLLMIQHFLTIGLAGTPGAAKKVNERHFLRNRVKAVGQATNHIVNFVSVDFVDLPNGDILKVVNELNGVGKYQGKPLLNIPS